MYIYTFALNAEGAHLLIVYLISPMRRVFIHVPLVVHTSCHLRVSICTFVLSKRQYLYFCAQLASVFVLLYSASVSICTFVLS